ncbi:MAG: hypothetical protein PHZ03_01150 [Syntrophomonas sp.]|nr:hypothetical protein [Syntrophomonas sp.]
MYFKKLEKLGFSIGLAPLAHARQEQLSNVADRTIHVIAGYAAGGFWLTGCIMGLHTVRHLNSRESPQVNKQYNT